MSALQSYSVAKGSQQPVACAVAAAIFAILSLLAGRVTAAVIGNPVTVLHSFAGGMADGANPEGELCVANSTIYGTTDYGGSSNAGTLFRFDTISNSYTILHNFAGGNSGGESANAPILVGNRLIGSAYGVNVPFPSVIYSFDLIGASYSVLHTFSTNDGSGPYGGLIPIGSKLYGVASFAGTSGCGTLFSFDPSNNGFAVLHTFTGPDGKTPSRLLAVGSKLYGTTDYGGNNAQGNIFSFDTSNNIFNRIYNFTGGADGGTPAGGLISVGTNLYGTTVTGNGGKGTVYSFDPVSSTFTILHSFAGGSADGSSPTAGLTLVGSDLYGMANSGGAANHGTIFRMHPDGSAYETVHSFNSDDGASPEYALAQIGQSLYGSTVFGGETGKGVLFSIPIPEPAALAPLGLAAATALRIVRRRRHQRD